MVRARERLILASLALAVLALAGCSPAPLMERLPAHMGGLPAGAPAAPKTPYKYPAVHDMPPPRADEPLTVEQQYKLEKDLQALRKRVQREGGNDPPADQKDAPKTKKKAEKDKKQENAGASGNP